MASSAFSRYAPTFRGSVLLDIFSRSAVSTKWLTSERIYSGTVSQRYLDELTLLVNAGVVPRPAWKCAESLFYAHTEMHVPDWREYSPGALGQVKLQIAVTTRLISVGGMVYVGPDSRLPSDYQHEARKALDDSTIGEVSSALILGLVEPAKLVAALTPA